MSGSRYAFRKRRLRAAARLFDGLGGAAWRLRAERPAREATLPQRVLLVRLDHLGDGIFVGPALAALRAALPRAELVLLAGPWATTLYGGGYGVDSIEVRLVPWFARPRRAGSWAAWREIHSWIREQRFDAAIDFRGDVRHLAWFALAGIPVRLGYARTGGGFWITHPVAYRDAHEVERNLDLVRVLAPTAQAGPLLPPACGAAEAGAVEALLGAAGCTTERRPVVFHVTAGYPSKRWEPDSMARAIDLVHQSELGPVVIVGTADERPAIEAILDRAQSAPHVLAGRTTLAQLGALLGRSRGFVGHDSGPAHLAVAAGIPAVLVYSGVNDLRSWGPWGGRTRVLHQSVSCSPCGLTVCNRNHECMRDLAPEAVLAALRDLLAGLPGGRS